MPKAGSDASEVSLDGQQNPMWLCCELTYRCPLKCVWCNNPLDFDRYKELELSTEEWKRVLREAREMGALQLGLTGGEPAVRDDLEEIVAEAHGLGYYTNLITSGLHQIQVSIQGSDHKVFANLVGADALDHKIAITREMKALGFPIVLNVPVTRDSMEQTPQILALAEDLGVDYMEYVQVQYYNWALLNRDQLLPTLDQLKRAEAQVMEARERLADKMTIYFVINDYYSVEMGAERAGKPKACMNGWGAIHLTIAPDGGAMPCQEARVIKTIDFPNVRDHDLAWIWQESPQFNKFRGDDWMKEPCRGCNEKSVDFGGCRCQAYLLTGDEAGCDPTCTKSPDHHLITRARDDAMRVPYVRKPLVRRQPGAVMTEVGGPS